MAQQNGNIDERLDRLVERHEALSQTVEHLAIQGEEQNRRIDRLLAAQERLLQAQEKDGEHIHALVRIAEIHERRLSALEAGEPGQ